MIARRLAAVLLSLAWAGPLDAQITPSRWVSPCTLDVVLVTFRDTTARHPDDPVGSDYHEHDRPHGYTMEDFRRLFSGGYDYSVNGETPVRPAAFEGDTVRVANRTETLPEVFGSLRHYLHVVSGGAFELRVRILNRETNDYPVWVQLPETKAYYAERARRQEGREAYWDDARAATRDSVRAWNLDTTAYDPPHNGYGIQRRLRHKVLYLYSGFEVQNNGLLHPRVDHITGYLHPRLADPQRIGYRYVAGERQGSGQPNGRHEADRFTGIGIHAHEMGTCWA